MNVRSDSIIFPGGLQCQAPPTVLVRPHATRREGGDTTLADAGIDSPSGIRRHHILIDDRGTPDPAGGRPSSGGMRAGGGGSAPDDETAKVLRIPVPCRSHGGGRRRATSAVPAKSPITTTGERGRQQMQVLARANDLHRPFPGTGSAGHLRCREETTGGSRRYSAKSDSTSPGQGRRRIAEVARAGHRTAGERQSAAPNPGGSPRTMPRRISPGSSRRASTRDIRLR